MGSAAGTLVALCRVPLRHPWLRSEDGIRGLALGTRRMVGDTLKIRKVIINVLKGKNSGPWVAFLESPENISATKNHL